MAGTAIVIYKEENGEIPLIEWLDRLSDKIRIKCIVKIELLQQQGYHLRRPHCDLLKQGIYELRMKSGNVNYRILYGFVGKNIVLLSHGLTKENKIPQKDIDRAIVNLKKYTNNPESHTHTE